MSTELEFLCILPDFPGAQSKRMEVRPKHLENALNLNAKNVVPFAGAMLAAHVESGQVPSFKGSVLVVRASSEEECRSILQQDVYVSAQVWDMDSAQIIPFKTALVPKQG
ncbi:YCII-related domain protein [Taphrina deformans PYCC 5710]|uniref:YCII-related domain protein n=1 Tax=Taphrina deformans (strain PYCC 5710 / ATCC 11124 / CBS 356.35 / IMI 108563 / JCM 9778 / NBRC 8474) TaxID=1097556 RepID=R4X6T8_TAPDE|nr:YCII-related domain protein [Taphrina deformans PYCC 5710]|eukprot:CCG80656.1 YCII-related domain protein [Taphrina deformans PYCC 5710]